MKLGIMQPYYLPYIGYWQLLNAVDKYVIYDDVNFIKGGWINRNRILNNGRVQYINVLMQGASSYKHINEIRVQNNEPIIEKTKKTLWNAYHKCNEFEKVFPLLCEVLDNGRDNLAEYLEFSIRKICQYLEIETELYVSSEIEKNNALHGEEKVLDICDKMGANVYYNAVGGRELYHFEKFEKYGVKLSFVKTNEIEYPQKNDKFVPNLSIIDVMMYNNISKIKRMLQEYTIIEE